MIILYFHPDINKCINNNTQKHIHTVIIENNNNNNNNNNIIKPKLK
jgi:hypothetical protein